MSTQMQAFFVEDGSLVQRKTAIPTPTEQQVLIRTHAAALNRADIFQRQGSYPPPEDIPNIPGLEVSGIVEACGEDVTQWSVGDAVCALLPGGGYAEYAVVHGDHCLPVPSSLSLQDAACLPEAAATVWLALFETAKLQPGERVLIHGGASGIGTFAIQMARAHGCEVFATAGSKEKTALCKQLGATSIDYKREDFVEIVKQHGGVDVVLDMVGGDYVARNMKVLNRYGRLITIALLGGSDATIKAASLLLKNLSWHGITLRSRSDAEKTELLNQMHQTVWPWIEQGSVTPVIDGWFAFDEAAAAQEKMEKYLHHGKIGLQLRSNHQ